MRPIVKRRACRQTLLAHDPENRLLARGPRFRLSAEVVRDNALAIAGLLDDSARRPVGQAVSAGRALGRAGRRRRRGALHPGQGAEPLPTQPLRLSQADRAASGPGHIRRPQPRDLPGEACPDEYPAPGPRAAQRRGLRRGRPGTGPAHDRRGRLHARRADRVRVPASRRPRMPTPAELAVLGDAGSSATARLTAPTRRPRCN